MACAKVLYTSVQHLVQTWSSRCGQPRNDRFIDPCWLSCKRHFTTWTGAGQPEWVDEPVNAGPIHICGTMSAHVGNVWHYHSLVSAMAPLGKHHLLRGQNALLLVQIPPMVETPKENVRLVWLSACNFAPENTPCQQHRSQLTERLTRAWQHASTDRMARQGHVAQHHYKSL